MKIEAGKYYRTRDGRKVGPMQYRAGFNHCWIVDYGDGLSWRCDGTSDYRPNIIAEWTDEETGPVRTVTRKEIVPGVYGKICVSTPACGGVYIGIGGVMGNSYVNNHGAKCQLMSLRDLRAAIAALTEIADCMEENQ